jgi:hypothetical protein
MIAADHKPNAPSRQSDMDTSEDTIMRCLHVIVDELKRERPPSASYMEG